MNPSNHMFLTYCAYFFGVIGVGIDISCYLVKSQKLFKKVAIVNAAVWSLQYFCLYAYSAGLTLIVAMFRVYLSEKCKNETQKWLLLTGSGAIFLSLALVSWSGWISLVPVVALCVTTHAMTFKDNIGMRKELIIAILLWMLNDFYWHAYLAIFSNVITFIFNMVVIYKMIRLAPTDNIHGLTKEI